MYLDDLKNKIQSINPEFTDELLDLFIEYIIKNLEKNFNDYAKKIGITSLR